jgi:hypothetical protein
MLLLAALGLLIATLSPHQTWARASVEAGPYGVRALLVGQATGKKYRRIPGFRKA